MITKLEMEGDLKLIEINRFKVAIIIKVLKIEIFELQKSMVFQMTFLRIGCVYNCFRVLYCVSIVTPHLQ